MRRDAIETHRREKSNAEQRRKQDEVRQRSAVVAREALRQIQPNEQERAERETKPKRKGEAPENGASERGQGDAVADRS